MFLCENWRKRKNDRLLWNAQANIELSNKCEVHIKSYPKIQKNLKSRKKNPKKGINAQHTKNSDETTNGHKQLNAYTVSICVNN